METSVHQTYSDQIEHQSSATSNNHQLHGQTTNASTSFQSKTRQDGEEEEESHQPAATNAQEKQGYSMTYVKMVPNKDKQNMNIAANASSAGIVASGKDQAAQGSRQTQPLQQTQNLPQKVPQNASQAHYQTYDKSKQQTQNKPPGSQDNLSALDRLKLIQAQYKASWVGIQTEFTGKPGTSTMCNKLRVFKTSQAEIDEDKRADQLMKLLDTLRNVENDFPLLISAGNDRQSRTQQNFFSKASKNLDQGISQISAYMFSAPYQVFNQQVIIKAIEKSQLLHNTPPTMQPQRSYHIDNCEMLYKLLKGDTKLVRSLLEANNFNFTESHEWNILWSSSSCKSYLYEGLNEYQRINHFPQSYEITRKDRLCFNYVKMQERFGRQAFDFIPDTYILPNEFHDFHAHYQKLKQTEPKRNVWIVKPANSSRGRGIHLIEDINDLNVDEMSVISRYISNPLLINGHKFDLRIYVVVTSYEPLRVYVFKEGLARFASESYSTKFNKNNKFMHLTNYSINKKNEKFVQNEDKEQDDVGFKWSLSAFCNHLEQVGIDMDLLWSRIYDVILKTLACGEHYVLQAMKKNGMYRLNCFEVFGFDILLDSDLKPWLVEVNLSPSLAPESPLDMTIKTNLLTDTFNLCNIKRFDRRKESLNKLKYRSKAGGFQTAGTGAGKAKSYTSNTAFVGSIPLPTSGSNDIYIANFIQNPQVEYLIDRLMEEHPEEYEDGQLSEPLKRACQLKFRDIIAETVSEFTRKGNFVRIYPARNSKMYDRFFAGQKHLNKIIYKVLFSSEILPYARGGDKTVKQVSGKQNTLMSSAGNTLEGGKTGSRQSVNRVHSSSGVRPVRSSKSNGKLLQSNNTVQNEEMKDQLNSANSSQPLKQVRQISHSTQSPRAHFGHNSAMQNSSEKRQSQTQIGNHQLSAQNTLKRRTTGNAGAQMAQIAPNSAAQPLVSKTLEAKDRDAVQGHRASGTIKPVSQAKDSSSQADQTPPAAQKVMITGDDILIEYVKRLSTCLGRLQEDLISFSQIERMEKFITHYVWHLPDKTDTDNPNTGRLPTRLQNRLGEMTDRRRRLIKYMFKKENRLDQFEEQYPTTIRRKEEVIHKFTSMQLEELLNNSTKNVAQEVVTCLIPKKGEGVLVTLETQHPGILTSHGNPSRQQQQRTQNQLQGGQNRSQMTNSATNYRVGTNASSRSPQRRPAQAAINAGSQIHSHQQMQH